MRLMEPGSIGFPVCMNSQELSNVHRSFFGFQESILGVSLFGPPLKEINEYINRWAVFLWLSLQQPKGGKQIPQPRTDPICSRHKSLSLRLGHLRYTFSPVIWGKIDTCIYIYIYVFLDSLQGAPFSVFVPGLGPHLGSRLSALGAPLAGPGKRALAPKPSGAEGGGKRRRDADQVHSR